MTITSAVSDLASELRNWGVPVSVAEVEDAVNGLCAVDLGDRDEFKIALRATLAKEPAAVAAFDRLFDILFPLTRPAPDDGGEVEPSGEDVEDRLARALKNMDRPALKQIASQMVQGRAGVQPGAPVSDEHYRYRALRHVDLEDMLRRLVHDDVQGKGETALDRRLIEEDFRDRMKEFSDDVTEEIRRRRKVGVDLQSQLDEARPREPETVDFLWAKESDLDSMRAAIYQLSRRLAARLSHKRRAGRRGRLDVRRTIRRSLSFGGAPVEPRWRRPVGGKPELWVLCDISGSMRNFTRFTLELVYALATQFQRVRSFVFVDGVDEVSDKLCVSDDFVRALERIDAEANVVAFDGQSWYGNALSQFWHRYGCELSPRATMLVVGDARNNQRTSGADVLAEIKRNVHRVWWLNPEPNEYWDSADSIAGELAQSTDGMFECRNLEQLERFVSSAL
jgi:uncharacterized protein